MNSSPKYTPRPMSNTTTYALGGLALVIVALIVFAAFRWGADEPAVRNDGYGPAHDPAVQVSVSDGVVRLGREDAGTTLDIYEDPLCPACGSLERLYGQEIAQQLDEGALAVRYHMLAFLDERSGSGDYSTRAVAALYCVADTGSGPGYAAFHDALFTERQPAEDGDDLGNDELAALAEETGNADATACITEGDQQAAAARDTAANLDDLDRRLEGRAATPSVFDGETRIDVNDENWVVNAVS